MNLELDENNAVNLIKAYAPGKVIIRETTYTDNLIITPTRILPHFQPAHLSELTAAHLQCVLELNPRILILGTGKDTVYVKPEIYGNLLNAGIGVETMNTHAACRTYNALASENRDVAAILMLA